MSAWARLVALDLRRVTRSTGTAAAIIVLLVLGTYGAWRAGASVEAAEASLAAAETAYDDQLDFLLATYPPATEAGEILYYLAFPASQPPSSVSALARGRAAVETESLRIRLLALEGQLYEHETVNPRLAAAGALDLAFLLIALLPLFIIAVSHDLISGERESGAWNLVRLFAPPRRLLAAKLASRSILVGAVAAFVMAAGAVTAGIGLDGRAGWMFALVALNTVFWFALCLAVAAGRRSSAAGAMILAGIWVVLTILAPAALSLANAVLHPVPEALELTVQQRQGYHEAWDLPPSATMESFYRDYPEWSDQDVPEDVFTWGWYYAMQHRGDRAAREASRTYRDTLRRREAWARKWSLIAPPLAAQLALDRLARTDLAAQLDYQDAVRRFHERLKDHFFPHFFLATPIEAVAWDEAPVFEPAAPSESPARAGFPAAIALILGSGLALGVGARRARA